MNHEITNLLISIVASTEGQDILNSIASSCQGIQQDESEHEKTIKFGRLPDLFYGEMYEISLLMKHIITTNEIELSSEEQELLDAFVSNIGSHNILNYVKNKIDTIYNDIGETPPVDTDIVDILRGLHTEAVQVHRFRLTKAKNFIGNWDRPASGYTETVTETFGEIIGSPNGICKIYIGDKKDITLQLTPFKLVNTPDLKTCPVVAVSSREYDLCGLNDSNKFNMGFNATDYFVTRNGFAKKELTNDTSYLQPDVAYFADRNKYTIAEHSIHLDNSILLRDNVRWLYLGIDDTSSYVNGNVDGCLDVKITSTYDSYKIRT